MMNVVLGVVGTMVLVLLFGAVVSIVLAIRRRLWYARKKVAIARICIEELRIEEPRRGLAPPPRKWAVSIDFESGSKPLIFLQMRGESARRVVDLIIPRLRRIGIRDYSFIAGPLAQASAEAHFIRSQSRVFAPEGVVTPVEGLHVRNSARVIKRPAPGRVLALVRWFCGRETRDLIDVIRADLDRDQRDMRAEGHGPALIWFQQTVCEWREILGIAGRFLLRLAVTLNPLAKLIDRQ